MAMFVHLTPESRLNRIRRNGIGRLRAIRNDVPKGIFAVPVTRNFYISHQWVRELKRGHSGSIAGVYFRLPDNEPVWIGHYREHHNRVTAAEAVALFSSAEDAQGWEILVPRRIYADELHRIRFLPQVLGWRYSPEAKGKKPFCTCKFCTRGEYGAKRLRTRLGSLNDP